MLFSNHSFYPIIKSDKFEETIEFYTTLFDFHPVYEIEGFTVLQREGADKQYLGIMSTNKAVLSNNANEPQFPTAFLNFYVENVRLAYQQFQWMGVEMVSDIETALCGHKTMMLRDPSGNILTVTQPDKKQDKNTDNMSEEEFLESVITGTH